MSLGYPDLQWSLNKISQWLLFTFLLSTKMSINLLDFDKIYKLTYILNRLKRIMNNHQILAKKVLYVGNRSPVVTEEDLNDFLVLRQLVTSKKRVKLNYLCVPKRVILDVLLM